MTKWLWKSDKGNIYIHCDDIINIASMIKQTGDQLYQYHNGEIKTLEEGRQVYRIVAQLHNQGNDLVAPKPLANTDTANPPTPLSQEEK